MKFLAPLILIMLLSFSTAFGQSKKKEKVIKNPEAIFSHEPSSRGAARSEESYGSGKSNKVYGKKSFNLKLDQKVEEYEERMKDNEKKYKKMERMMKKPQYSDPSYFGHKKKPKKRPPGKKKFCKECGIKH